VAKDQSKDQSKEPEKKKSKDEQKEQIRQVQVGIRKLAEKLADAIMALPDGKYAQVAVLTFQETGKLTKDKELGTLVAAELMTYLHKEHGLYIVERDKLDKVIKELQVQQSGLVDDNTASKIGKMVAAQALILGTVSEAGASFIVNARVVSVETAKVMVADNVSFPASGMVSLSKNAVELKSKWGAVYRSLVVPGWGQIYNNQEIKGGIYLGVTVAFFTTAIVFEVEGNQLVDDYKKATDPNAIKNIKKNIEDKYQIRNIAIYCGIAMWAINIIDAAVFGYDASKAIAKVPVLKDAKLALGAGGGMLSWGQEF
jgi:TolB-like protein